MELAYHNGARTGSAEIMEIDLIPLQYVENNAVRAIVRAVSRLILLIPPRELFLTAAGRRLSMEEANPKRSNEDQRRDYTRIRST